MGWRSSSTPLPVESMYACPMLFAASGLGGWRGVEIRQLSNGFQGGHLLSLKASEIHLAGLCFAYGVLKEPRFSGRSSRTARVELFKKWGGRAEEACTQVGEEMETLMTGW